MTRTDRVADRELRQLAESVIAAVPVERHACLQLPAENGAHALVERLQQALLDCPRVQISLERLRDVLILRTQNSDRVLDDNSLTEIVLACGCADGSDEAIRLLEQRSFDEIERVVRRLRLPANTVDEITQTLRMRLFVAPPGGVPRILREAGRGDFRILIRVAATRYGLNLLRDSRRLVSDGNDLGLDLAAKDDPELSLLRSTYHSVFKRTLEQVVGALEHRDRTLLRLSLVDRLSIDDIGVLYSVHRATSARWVAEARRRVVDNVEHLLRHELHLTKEELLSLFARVKSGFEITLSRVLATKLER